MPTRHPPSSLAQESWRNRFCRDVGHDWSATMLDGYRRCLREQCGALQRLEQGHWVTIERPRVGHNPVAGAEQAALW